MMIRSFSASNVLKYRSLRLPELPERGLIGISGANEAGKSAIAEAMCLALYGRTFSVPAERLDKLVRWGAQHADVSLDFESGGRRYCVVRHIDYEARQSATLTQGEALIASGPTDVNAAVARLTGCDFTQYVDAFYLAQKEFQAPHPQSRIMRDLLGVADLDRVAARLERLDQEDHDHLDTLRHERDALNTELDALNPDAGTLDALLTQQQRHAQALTAAREALERAQHGQEQTRAGLAALDNGIETALALRPGGDADAFRAACRDLERGATELQTGLDEPALDPAPQTLRAWGADLAARLEAFQALSDRARAYAARLERRLGREPDADADAAEDHEPRYAATEAQRRQERADLASRHSRNRWAFWLFTLAGLCGAGLWALFAEPGAPFPEPFAAWLLEVQNHIAPRLPALTEPRLPMLGGAAAVALGLALALFIRGRGLRRLRIRNAAALADLEREIAYAREETAQLAELEAASLEARSLLITQLGDKALHQAAVDFREQQGQPLLQARTWETYRQPLAQAAETWDQDRAALSARAEARLETARSTLRDLETEAAQQAQAIEAEHERRLRAERIRNRRTQLAQAATEPEHRIRVRERALALIAETRRGVYAQFKTQMRAYLGRLVPLITDDRYRHLKIRDDFSIQVFSTEKNDFLDLEDLSSGAQRQILLVMRLAIAQALVDAHGEAARTLMLDEPFAFFDRARMNQTLKTLSDFSAQIGQIWVISQEFDAAARFDLHIDCRRDTDVLEPTTSA